LDISRELFNTLAIAGKDLTELYRSRIRLFTLILMPLLLMTIFGYMFPSGTSLNHIAVGIVQLDHGDEAMAVAGKIVQMATSSGTLDVSSFASVDRAKEALLDGRVKGILVVEPGFSDRLALGGQGSIRLILDQTSPTIAGALSTSVAAILGAVSAQIAAQKGSQALIAGAILLEQESIVPGAASNTFEFMAPGFLAMMVMMGGMGGLASAISRERELGTLDGMMMSPISRFSVIFGKALSQTARGFFQGLIMIGLTMLVFGVRIYGSPILMLLVLLLGVLGFVGIGIIATSIAGEQESATMILQIMQLPMMFLSGMLYPIEQLPGWMQMIAKALPLTYAITALRKVMVLGAPLMAISSEILILAAIAVLTVGLAIPLFERAITR